MDVVGANAVMHAHGTRISAAATRALVVAFTRVVAATRQLPRVQRDQRCGLSSAVAAFGGCPAADGPGGSPMARGRPCAARRCGLLASGAGPAACGHLGRRETITASIFRRYQRSRERQLSPSPVRAGILDIQRACHRGQVGYSAASRRGPPLEVAVVNPRSRSRLPDAPPRGDDGE